MISDPIDDCAIVKYILNLTSSKNVSSENTFFRRNGFEVATRVALNCQILKRSQHKIWCYTNNGTQVYVQ